MATSAAAISLGESLTTSGMMFDGAATNPRRDGTDACPLADQRQDSPARNKKGRHHGGPMSLGFVLRLQGGFDLKAPCFQQRLGDVLGILVPSCPLPQTRRPQVLVGGELILAHHLLELGDRGGDRPNGFRLTPVWVSASLCHEVSTTSSTLE